MREFKLSIIIPVFNEENTILEILAKVERIDLGDLGFSKEIIIVDDGSTDGTREILKKSKYRFLSHPRNLGKEEAIKTALREIRGDYVIIQDADLEYDPEDYRKLISLALEKDAPVVYGSRWLNPGNIHPYKMFYWGGVFLTFLANLLYHQKLTDVLTCYKFFKGNVLKSINLEYSGFEFCCEVTAKVGKRGIKIEEVPIEYHPRKNEELKKIKLTDGLKMISVLLVNKFKGGSFE